MPWIHVCVLGPGYSIAEYRDDHDEFDAQLRVSGKNRLEKWYDVAPATPPVTPKVTKPRPLAPRQKSIWRKLPNGNFRAATLDSTVYCKTQRNYFGEQVRTWGFVQRGVFDTCRYTTAEAAKAACEAAAQPAQT